MNQLHKIAIGIIWLFCYLPTISVTAQDSVKQAPSVALRYFVHNNNIQYLLIQSRVKVGKKFQAVPGYPVQLYLDSNIAENLVAKSITNINGDAKVVIPAVLKDKWNASPRHTFIALSGAEEDLTSIEITKAKILLDTTTIDSIRTLNVKVMFLQNNDWIPAADVEMKVGVARAGGILPAGEEATYTTDSTGTVTVDFKRDNLPGDVKGNFVLVAKVEDNDLYGNLLIEKTVPWGIAVKPDLHFFDQRTLWSTRFKTPVWLLFMAYSIVMIVWGVIIYLVFLLIKIKKAGNEKAAPLKIVPGKVAVSD